MGTPGARSLILDAGALIGVERRTGRTRATLQVAVAHGVQMYLPAPVVVEVWRGGTGRQAPLARFLNTGFARGYLQVVSLSFEMARQIGAFLASAGAPDVGVTDAMVAWCALRFDGNILTSDPRDLQRLVARDRIEQV